MKEKKKKVPVLKRLMSYAGNKGCMLYLAMFLSAASGIMILMPMVYIHKIVSTIILSGQIDVTRVRENAVLAASFAGAGLGTYVFAIILSHIFAFEVEDNIIKLSVSKLMEKPLGFFLNRESGKLRSVIIGGAGETHSFLAHQLPDMAMTMITPVVLLFFFFLFDWKLGIASMFPMIIGVCLMGTMMTKKGKLMRDKYYADLANLSSETVEYVRGIPVVKTFAQSIESFDRLYSLIVKMKDSVIKLTMSYRNKMAVFEAITGSTAFFLVPVALLILATGGNVREVLGNSVIYFLIGPAFGTFILRSATISQYTYFAELALNRIDDILDYDNLAYGRETSLEGGLEFKNVSFSYGTEKVLDNISFKVNQGETVALVGSSGGGKTTIARLAARFYDADEGEVLAGRVNIKEYDKKSLMNKIAFVFQNSKLFKMSLRENICMGRDYSDAEITSAIEASSCQNILARMDNGLDTIIGQKGTYISGGEAQRISIARAFLKNAPILLLDEATAFADPENENKILKSLEKLKANKTTIMIAHRLNSIKNVDEIIVMKKGQILDKGKHDYLIDNCPYYKDLYNNYSKSIEWRV